MTPLRIPETFDFAQLRLARDPKSGAVDFDTAPIVSMLEDSGIDPSSIDTSADSPVVTEIIVSLYREHRARGGAADSVMEQLISEAEIEDQRGGGFSHAPGRA